MHKRCQCVLEDHASRVKENEQSMNDHHGKGVYSSLYYCSANSGFLPFTFTKRFSFVLQRKGLLSSWNYIFPLTAIDLADW